MIEAFELMENHVEKGYSKTIYQKNQSVNKYLRERFNTNTDIYWSPKYLENAYKKLFGDTLNI